MSEVDPVIVNRKRKTYFEIKPRDVNCFINAVKIYIDFMKTEEVDIIDEFKSLYPELKIHGVFYEIA